MAQPPPRGHGVVRHDPLRRGGLRVVRSGAFRLRLRLPVAHCPDEPLVLGHYLIAPPWRVSFKINVFIMAEAIAALLMGTFTAWLQVRRTSPNQSE